MGGCGWKPWNPATDGVTGTSLVSARVSGYTAVKIARV